MWLLLVWLWNASKWSTIRLVELHGVTLLYFATQISLVIMTCLTLDTFCRGYALRLVMKHKLKLNICGHWSGTDSLSVEGKWIVNSYASLNRIHFTQNFVIISKCTHLEELYGWFLYVCLEGLWASPQLCAVFSRLFHGDITFICQ